jgi:ubiquinone/menaquinone biosynthesis C-methylase UbiE
MTTTTSASHGSRGGWQLEADSAEAYERYLVPALMAAGAARLVELASPLPGNRVLDVGCGTGIVARSAAPRVGASGRVVGIDLNEGMLRVARRTAADLVPPVEWRQGDAISLPFPDGSFDVVASQQMLQFVPDPARAAREMRRVLATSGRLALSVCRPIEHAVGYVPLAQGLRRHAGAAAEEIMRSPFPAWSIEDFRRIVAAAGFASVTIRIEVASIRYPSAAEFVRREAACSPLAGPIGALPAPSRAALIDELARELAPHTDDLGLALPLEVYVALAEKR